MCFCHPATYQSRSSRRSVPLAFLNFHLFYGRLNRCVALDSLIWQQCDSWFCFLFTLATLTKAARRFCVHYTAIRLSLSAFPDHFHHLSSMWRCDTKVLKRRSRQTAQNMYSRQSYANPWCNHKDSTVIDNTRKTFLARGSTKQLRQQTMHSYIRNETQSQSSFTMPISHPHCNTLLYPRSIAY